MTATVRSVRVVMEADVAGYVRDMRLAGHETDKAFSNLGGNLKSVNTRLLGTQKRLEAVSTANQKAGTSIGQLNTQLASTDRQMASVERSTGRATSQLDTFSGRTGLLLKLAAGLGPALLPIGAIGVPALAGLAAQGGFLVGALGATVLALRGVGDGVKALEKAKLDPTIENVQEAQAVLRRLGPDVASLVLNLDNLKGARDKLQASAAAGLIPGLNEALVQLETGVPMARRLVREFGDITGDIASRAAEDLTSDRWSEFFDYLQSDARPILDDTASTLGNLAHAFGQIFVATSGDQQAFTAWLRDTTESFDQWATRLDTNTDFQAFLAYARENGPAVADALGSIVTALAAVVEAAAPLGGPTLQILETIADVIGAIASSPLGSPLVSAISAYSLLSSVLPGVKKGYDGVSTAQGKLEGQFSKGKTAITTAAGDLANVARYGNLATESSKRLRTQLGPLIKGGAGLAGLAVAGSGVANGMGLTNTASLALLGTLGGPWGAAIGGAVGLVLDLKDANAKGAKSVEEFDRALDAMSPADFDARAKAIDSLRQSAVDYKDDVRSDSFGEFLKNSFDPDAIANATREAFGIDTIDEKMNQAADAAEAAGERIKLALASIASANGDPTYVDDVEKLGEVATQVEPYLSRLGLTIDDLGTMSPDALAGTVSQIESMMRLADGGAERMLAVSNAIADLDNELLSTSESAAGLRANLDALLGPQLGLSAATDEWTTALRHLKDDLSDNSRTLQGNSDAAIQNREAIRGRVSQLTDVLVAEAQAGASSQQLAGKLRAQRKALIDAGEAAGISKGEMRGYLNELGLTPNLVKTVIENNAPAAAGQVRGLNAALSATPRYIKTVIAVYRENHGGGLQGQKDNPLLSGVGSADGSTVPKTGGAYADRHPYMLADGEEVVSNRHGQADRHRPLLKAINANRLADGGTASSTYTSRAAAATTSDKADDADDRRKTPRRRPTVILDLEQATIAATSGVKGLRAEFKALEKQSNRLERASKKQQEAVEAATTAQENARAAYDGIISSTTSLLTSDIFAADTSSSPWAPGGRAGGMDPIGALEADIANTKLYDDLVAQLSGRGLGEGALQEAAGKGIPALQLLAGYSDTDLSRFGALYDQRAGAVAGSAASTADLFAGDELAAANDNLARANQLNAEALREQKETTKAVNQVKNALGQYDKSNREGQRENAKDVGNGMKSATGRGKRDRVRGGGSGGRVRGWDGR